jgi:hypothetical protein
MFSEPQRFIRTCAIENSDNTRYEKNIAQLEAVAPPVRRRLREHAACAVRHPDTD